MSITNLAVKREGGAWVVAFDAADENGFAGRVRHAHLPDLGERGERLHWACDVLSNLPYVGIAFTVISKTWTYSKNRDGTYDMYVLVGSRRVGGWPFFFLFWGFVADVSWYPPVKLNSVAPGPMLPTPGNLILWPHIRAMADHFRLSPAPPAQEQPPAYSGRRFRGNMLGERFLANIHTKEIHDLDHEDTSPRGCQIDEIIDSRHDRPYNDLGYARDDGYDACARCLGQSLPTA